MDDEPDQPVEPVEPDEADEELERLVAPERRNAFGPPHVLRPQIVRDPPDTEPGREGTS